MLRIPYRTLFLLGVIITINFGDDAWPIGRVCYGVYPIRMAVECGRSLYCIPNIDSVTVRTLDEPLSVRRIYHCQHAIFISH